MKKSITGIYNNNSYIPGKNITMDSWVEEWRSHTYPKALEKVLLKYDNANEIGDLVLDIASGPEPLSFKLSNTKKIILIDIVPMVCSLKCDDKEVIPIWADLNELINNDTYKFIGSYGRIDTVIASSIFNYINWKKFLSMQGNFHKKGGYLFIANLYGKHGSGIRRLFSEHRPKSSSEIIETLTEHDYKIIDNLMEGRLNIIIANKM